MPHAQPPDKDAGQNEREPQEGHEHIKDRPSFGAAGEVEEGQVVHAAKGDDESEKARDPFAVHRQGVGG